MATHVSLRKSAHVMVTLAVVALAALLILAVPASAAPAASLNPGIVPFAPGPYEQLAEHWYTWALSYPSALGSLPDPFGTDPYYGQSGPVWFLAGNFNPGEYHRTVTVPEGKALFFPVVNTVYVGFPSDPALTRSEVNATLAGQRAYVASHPVKAKIDGVPVLALGGYKVQTERDQAFTIELPTDNLFGFPPEYLPFYPSWQTGIYLLVAPLSPGHHTIEFHAKDLLDIYYDLTIEGGA